MSLTTIAPQNPNGQQEVSYVQTIQALPASGTSTIFTVSGPIEVLSIFGIVTTVIQTQSCNLKVSATVTGLTSVDVCANGAISALAVGTLLALQTSFATALAVAATNAVQANYAPTGFIMGGPGIITMTTSATNTGNVQWYIRYRPMSPGAFVM